MCVYCESDTVPVTVAEFLACLPRHEIYRTTRVCLWNAYLASQPPGIAPAEGKHELYRQVRGLEGVQELRTASGRWFAGIASQ